VLFGSGFFLLIWIVVWLWALVDAFTTDAEKVRGIPKAAWIILILIMMDPAAILWFVFGRARGQIRARVPQADRWKPEDGMPVRRRGGPVAPDDDPEFLLRLREELRRKERDDPGSGTDPHT
jgi:membrane-associated phospholipid phosphatase